VSKTATNNPYRAREPSERRISTTVYLHRDQLEALREMSEDTGVPMAAIIREGIDKELDRRKGGCDGDG
jgi:predicted DNA-binding protein